MYSWSPPLHQDVFCIHIKQCQACLSETSVFLSVNTIFCLENLQRANCCKPPCWVFHSLSLHFSSSPFLPSKICMQLLLIGKIDVKSFSPKRAERIHVSMCWAWFSPHICIMDLDIFRLAEPPLLPKHLNYWPVRITDNILQLSCFESKAPKNLLQKFRNLSPSSWFFRVYFQAFLFGTTIFPTPPKNGTLSNTKKTARLQESSLKLGWLIFPMVQL